MGLKFKLKVLGKEPPENPFLKGFSSTKPFVKGLT